MSRRVEGCLFIGRLSKSTRVQDLEKVFEAYGRLVRCDVKYGSEMAYGFISFEDHRDAEEALRCENGRPICESRILVEWAKASRRTDPFSVKRDHCNHVGHLARKCHNSGRPFGESNQDSGHRAVGGNNYSSHRRQFNEDTLERSYQSRDLHPPRSAVSPRMRQMNDEIESNISSVDQPICLRKRLRSAASSRSPSARVVVSADCEIGGFIQGQAPLGLFQTDTSSVLQHMSEIPIILRPKSSPPRPHYFAIADSVNTSGANQLLAENQSLKEEIQRLHIELRVLKSQQRLEQCRKIVADFCGLIDVAKKIEDGSVLSENDNIIIKKYKGEWTRSWSKWRRGMRRVCEFKNAEAHVLPSEHLLQTFVECEEKHQVVEESNFSIGCYEDFIKDSRNALLIMDGYILRQQKSSRSGRHRTSRSVSCDPRGRQ